MRSTAALSVLLAGVTAAVSRPLVEPVGDLAAGMAFDHAAPPRILLIELSVYPLFAAIGVALGVLLWRMPTVWRWLLLVLLAIGWLVATFIGLLQNDRFDSSVWLLGLPPVATATAVALAALLTSALAWAVLLNVLARARRRPRAATPPTA